MVEKRKYEEFGGYSGAINYLEDEYIDFVKLGKGSLGIVVKGQNKQKGKEEAIKIIKIGAIQREEAEIMESEIKKGIKCYHKYILNIQSIYTHKGWMFIIMPVCNIDLQKMLDTGLSKKEALKHMVSVCEGVEYLHAEKLVHRDLKPLNVIMKKNKTGTYIPKISDFGLARNSLRGANYEKLGISGTLVYMPPEWIMPKIPQDRDSYTGDNWAIGVMIYQIIEHNFPFHEHSIGKIVDYEYEELSKENKEWNDFFKNIFCPKENRWNAGEIRNNLLQILEKSYDMCTDTSIPIIEQPLIKENELEVEKLFELLKETEANAQIIECMQSESIPNIHRASLILYILQQSELKALELDDKHLGDTKIEHLCKGLFKNQTVTELDLNNIYHMFDQFNIYDIYFSIGDNDLTEIIMGELCDTLATTTSLRQLYLSYNNIKDEGLIHISKILELDEIPLNVLVLGEIGITNKGTEILCASLKENFHLKELSFGENKCGSEGCKYFGYMLQHNQHLKELNLGWNDIPDEGMEYLCEGLKSNSCLQKLWLWDNSIGDKGISCLNEALRANTKSTLRFIYLEDNQMGEEGKELMQQLKQFLGNMMLIKY